MGIMVYSSIFLTMGKIINSITLLARSSGSDSGVLHQPRGLLGVPCWVEGGSCGVLVLWVWGLGRTASRWPGASKCGERRIAACSLRPLIALPT